MRTFTLPLIALIVAGGTLVVSAQPAGSAKLESLIDRFIKTRGTASAEVSPEDITRRLGEQKAMLAEVRAVPVADLSPEQRIDQLVLIGQLEGTVLDLDTVRQWEKNPEIYVQFNAVSTALGRDGSVDEKATAVVSRLDSAVKVLGEARRNIRNPPKAFTDGAIYQANEWLGFLKKDVAGFANQAGASKVKVEAANAAAVAALESFVTYLKSDVAPKSTGTVAIGASAYRDILKRRWYMKDSPEAVLARGRKAFDDTERLAQEVANRITPGNKSWIDVYEKIKDDHPDADKIKAEYQAQMDAAQAYLKAHEIVTLPEGERVITIDTPPAMRRSSPFGTFSSVGPFEKELLGKLVLTPIEDNLTPEQRTERLRSHHRAWIPIIAVHEAYPGHHVQALKANENPRLLRRVIKESIFSEGWGLFCEEMMFEEGFLKGDDVRLTQLRNRLWRAARVIIDVGIHTGTMSFEEGVQFLVDKVRFERYAAELEVGMYLRRPTYVLGYLIGMMEIQDMRDAYYKKYGKPAKPKEFYDKLLRIGALPPSLVRAELLSEPVAPQ